MPKVLLIDIDSKIPNLALKKIEKYYQDRQDTVHWNLPIMANWADVIYVSCVFTWNRDKCREWETYPQAWIGGSGYDLDMTLQEDIERVRLSAIPKMGTKPTSDSMDHLHSRPRRVHRRMRLFHQEGPHAARHDDRLRSGVYPSGKPKGLL